MDIHEERNSKYIHPWELSRTKNIIKELKKIKLSGNILDIGCGDKYFDKILLKEFESSIGSLWGIDIFLEEDYHNEKEHYISSYEQLKDKKFDFILMMDVLEHIKKDKAFLNDLRPLLKENSILFITVPAFQSLFSLHDKELNHYRRYNKKELHKLLKENGYEILDSSYFYLSLIFMRLLTMNSTQNLGNWKYCENNLITKIIYTILNIDYTILRHFSKIGFHIGGLSLLTIVSINNFELPTG